MSKVTLRLNQTQLRLLRQVAAVALAGLFLLLLARTSSFTGQTYRIGSSGLSDGSDWDTPAATPGHGAPAAGVGQATAERADLGEGGSAFPAAGGSAVPSSRSEAEAERQRLESLLEATLSHVKGAGRVEVFLTLSDEGRLEVMSSETREISRSEEKEGQQQRTSLQDRMTRQPQLVRSGQQEEPVVTRRLRPEVAGVLVLAEGAGREEVRLQLLEAVATALGIAEHRVAVLPLATAASVAGTGRT
ncbi:MAG: hypothetical protein IMX00_05370 [Limnochordales bacterium]|nr:hypothetical protein [Limnochordales bacterium]